MSAAVIKQRVSVVAGTVMILASAALSGAATAQATTAQQATLCAEGNYKVQLEFKTNVGGSRVLKYGKTVSPGDACKKDSIPSGTTFMNVVGTYNVSGEKFYINSIGTDRSVWVWAWGTSTNPTASFAYEGVGSSS